MKKIIFILIATLFIFQKSFSENEDIYDKIDIFGEVLEKINKEYEKNNFYFNSNNISFSKKFFRK